MHKRRNGLLRIWLRTGNSVDLMNGVQWILNDFLDCFFSKFLISANCQSTMTGFECCDEWIDSDENFKRHILRGHFGFKSNPLSSGYYVCPIEYCRTELLRDSVRKHLKLCHRDLVPFLFKSDCEIADATPSSQGDSKPSQNDHQLPYRSEASADPLNEPINLDGDFDFDSVSLVDYSNDSHLGNDVHASDVNLCAVNSPSLFEASVHPSKIPVYKDEWDQSIKFNHQRLSSCKPKSSRLSLSFGIPNICFLIAE